MTRRLVDLVFCLLLMGCASAPHGTQALPEAFLGTWHPGGGYCVDLIFFEDGKMETRCDTDNKLISTGEYKVIHIAGQEDVYLAVEIREPRIKQEPFYRYYHYQIERTYFIQSPPTVHLTEEYYGLNMDRDEWHNLIPTQHWARLKSYISDPQYSGPSQFHYARH